jgi:hypothetical protein
MSRRLRTLSNRHNVILGLLQESHSGMTVNEVADAVRRGAPCSACGGSGSGDDPLFGCRECFGRGTALFYYSDAYRALRHLREQGLVRRRYLCDEWGDPRRRHIYFAESPNAGDPLERAFNLPSAEPGKRRSIS